MLELRNFTDAAADAVAREIATFRREAQLESELRAAEHAARLAQLDARIAAAAEIERRLGERLASLRDGQPGRDGKDGSDGRDGRDGDNGADGQSVTAEDCAPLILAEVERVLSTWERPRDGASVTADDVAPVLEEAVQRAVANLPMPKDGRDGADGKDGRDGVDGSSVTVDDLTPVVEATVERAVAALPVPKDGIDGINGRDGRDGTDGVSVTLDQLMPVVEEAVTRAVADIPRPTDGKDGRDGIDGRDGTDGKDGAPGKLPIVREWADKVHYEGDVVVHSGATYQATRDTAKEPPHDDWTCIARAGADGNDGRSFTIRGTWAEDGDYQALDVVALGGASFAARYDGPGACPGEGWQLIAAQGKRGNPGERGKDGLRGVAGVQIASMDVNDDGLLTIANDDGTQVECDLYPLLAKLKP